MSKIMVLHINLFLNSLNIHADLIEPNCTIGDVRGDFSGPPHGMAQHQLQ